MSNRSWHINTLFQVLDSSKYLKLLVTKLLLINFEVAQLVKLDANINLPSWVRGINFTADITNNSSCI
jgi:hypothetical protein